MQEEESYAVTVERGRARLASDLSSVNYVELQHLASALERVCNLYTERYLRDDGADLYVRDRMNACMVEYSLVKLRMAELLNC
jgi:hypothetical protein